MFIVILLTSLLTFTVLIITAAFYLVQLLSEESDDGFQSEVLSINATDFSSSPNISPLETDGCTGRRLSSESLCNNPAHHHLCGLDESAQSSTGGANVTQGESKQAPNGNEPNSRTSTKSLTDSLPPPEESVNISKTIVNEETQKQWSSSQASQTQKTLLTNQLGATVCKQLFDDFDPKEVQLGGTGLHWCKTRKSLYKLIKIGLPLGVVNKRHETAVHVAVRKKKLQVLIGLLCYGADVESLNEHGETPLIVAAKCNDIFSCQLLLIFDSNPNAVDKQGFSARHYVSTLCERRKINKSTESTSAPNACHIILAMLNEVAAQRCQPIETSNSSSQSNRRGSSGKISRCTDGCSYSGSYNGNSYNRWPDFSLESLYKRHMFKDLIEKEKQLRVKRRNNSSRSNTTQDSGNKLSRLLCFDGGGMRGIIVCQLMIELEKYLKRPMIDYFDWIGGTSAGAFISCALCTGTSLQQLRRICFDVKDEIFSGNKPYNAKFLERVLKRTYGPTTRMSDVKNKKLAVTTVLANREPCQLRIFRNYLAPTDILKSLGLSVDQYNSLSGHSIVTKSIENQVSEEDKAIDENEQDPVIWQAVRASGAAPFFFKPYGPYLDGGIISNNPTLDMLTEFFNYEKLKEFMKQKLKVSGKKVSESNPVLNDLPSKLGLVVSLGTGRGRVVSRQAIIDFGKVASGFSTVFAPVELVKSFRAARDLFKKLIQQSCQTEDYVLDRAQAWCSAMNTPYFRINPPLAAVFSIDDKRDEQLINALWQTKLYMKYMKPQLEELADLLDGNV